MSAVTEFAIERQGFQGALVGSWLQVMRAVSRFIIKENQFEGVLPESGIRTMSIVTLFEINVNSFEGTLPESGLQVMRTVLDFWVYRNRFRGTIPENGIRSMTAVIEFATFNNTLTGALPGSGLQVMRAVNLFLIYVNRFKGSLPENGIRTMRAITRFDINANSFEGALPGSGLQVMRAMWRFDFNTNSFAGALPGSGLRSMTAVMEFATFKNTFKGALPGSGLQVMRAVKLFLIYVNRFKGTLPESGTRTMRAITQFEINANSFEGALPGSGLQVMRAMWRFFIQDNHWKGTLPESGIRTMSAVTQFRVQTNDFEGALPGSWLQVMRAVSLFIVSQNRLKGKLPDSGIRTLSAVETFAINTNSFAGALPESGFHVMRAVSRFFIHTNGFKGTIPENGVRTMSAVTILAMQTNSFEGALPEIGLEVMRTIGTLFVFENRFAGTLPNRGVAGLGALSVSHNDFEGAIPSSLNPYVVFLGHNLLGGPIPQRLLGRAGCVMAEALLHEGTIPESASRLTFFNMTISFGHGLRGLLPSISGTLGLLSLWGNGLEGHMPELHMYHTSTLMAFSNEFSCKLPRHYGLQPSWTTSSASLSLIGNHFATPRCVPAWIMPAEQPTDMFCRSNRQSKKFILLFFCGGCCFVLAVIQLERKSLPMYGEFARARSAWYDTCQQHNRLVLVSCMLLPLYSNTLWLACTVVADHLRFHVGMRVPLEVPLVAFVHLWFYLSAARFHDRHVTQSSMRMAHPPRKAGFILGSHGSSRVYRWWIVVCVLISVPGIWYSMVKAVPGFLQVSDLWRWVISSTVALLSGLLTGFGLDLLAGQLCGPTVDRATLQLVAVLFSSILLPGLATILCHAECLGGWTSLWAPCRGMWPFVSKSRAVFRSPTDASIVGVFFDRVSRSDVCALRWHMNGRECMEAALEHLESLLYPKFVHYTFTIAAFRILKARVYGFNGMTLEDAYVLLKFLWLVVTLFGPCLPILHALIALLANIYSILLFGTCIRSIPFLYVEGTPAHVASLPRFGFSAVALLALALQSSNLL